MFDAPTRDLCSARRIATNTPLQALVTLNDPVYVECSDAYAARSNEQHGKVSDAIAWMFYGAVGRPPTGPEKEELERLYTDLSGNEEKDGIDLSAMKIVANTLFNLDEALTK